MDIRGIDDAIARKVALSDDIELYPAGHGEGAVVSQIDAMKTVRPCSEGDGVVTRSSQVTARRVIGPPGDPAAGTIRRPAVRHRRKVLARSTIGDSASYLTSSRRDRASGRCVSPYLGVVS